MQNVTQLQMAKVYRDAWARHEASFCEKRMNYTVPLHKCCSAATEEILGHHCEITANLIFAMIASGYCDFGDWADDVLDPVPA